MERCVMSNYLKLHKHFSPVLRIYIVVNQHYLLSVEIKEVLSNYLDSIQKGFAHKNANSSKY